MIRIVKEKLDDMKTDIAKKMSSFISKLPPNVQKKLYDLRNKYEAYSKSWLGDNINTIIFVIVMVIIIRFFVCEIRWIPSGSMTPTLIEQDRIVVERFLRFFTSPKRGDIMVFYPPSTVLSNRPIALLERLTGINCKDIAYIKRIVGVPGDKVEIKFDPDGAGYVYINDKKYKEDYIKSVYEYPACPDLLSAHLFTDSSHVMKCGPFYLDDDEYFMMGDNRGNSQDSRYWGVLKKDRFVGRAVLLWWPLNRFRIIHRPKNANF